MRLTARRAPSARDQAAVDPPVVSGLAELAVGALTGWVYTLAKTRSDAARTLGIKSAGRVRQWHLDLIALGGRTAMGGTAAGASFVTTSVGFSGLALTAARRRR